jgi:hypothetical protein
VSRLAELLREQPMGVPVKWGATRSGHATLVELDDVDARELTAGDMLLTRAATGYWALEVVGVRESAYGEEKDEPQLCHVVDTRVAYGGAAWRGGPIAGRALVFAPANLLRVAVKGRVGS